MSEPSVTPHVALSSTAGVIDLPSDAANVDHSAMRRLLRNPFAVISIVVLVAIILTALIVPFVIPFDRSTGGVFDPPSLHHPFGTDNLGYDILARVAVGARISLGIALTAEVAILVFGCAVGLFAGYFGGRVDTILMRLTDMMFAFPDILLAILVAVVLRSGFLSMFVALSVTGWPGMARLVRGQTLSLRRREFIDAARAIGVPHGQIMARHILPNLANAVIVAATIDIAGLVVAESTLSFLGLGVQRPLTSWGRLISDGLEYFIPASHASLLLYPAAFLMTTVLAINFLGDALRDALDPKGRK